MTDGHFGVLWVCLGGAGVFAYNIYVNVLHKMGRLLPGTRDGDDDSAQRVLGSLAIAVWPVMLAMGVVAGIGWVLFEGIPRQIAKVAFAAPRPPVKSPPAESEPQGPFRTPPSTCPTCGQVKKDEAP